MSTKKILVIEDNQKHLSDAKAFFADKPEYEVEYFTTAEPAIKLLDKYFTSRMSNPSIAFGYDGIITDLFLPWNDRKHTEEVPAGFGLAMVFERSGIPYVINTAGGAHGQRSYWVTECLSCMTWLDNDTRIVQAGSGDNDATTKNWSRAFQELVTKMDKPKS